ncbi:MAG: folate family ECF transporter S component [Clostridiales Family XIII bacterium]|jgi:ECF transporter S component (folate family)|nr:folate family ECF transporter S component [Clostridiales Family XIII bacterium]
MNYLISICTSSFKEFKNVKSITLGAMLIAIYAVSYAPYVGNIIIVPGVIEIRFGFLVVAIAAMFFGPIFGGAIAVMGDVLGTILFYGGAFFWGYTLSWLIQAIVFGFILYHAKPSLVRIIICMLFNTLVINLLFTTACETLMGFGTFEALFVRRIFLNAIMLPVNTVLSYFILTKVGQLRERAKKAA